MKGFFMNTKMVKQLLLVALVGSAQLSVVAQNRQPVTHAYRDALTALSTVEQATQQQLVQEINSLQLTSTTYSPKDGMCSNGNNCTISSMQLGYIKNKIDTILQKVSQLPSYSDARNACTTIKNKVVGFGQFIGLAAAQSSALTQGGKFAERIRNTIDAFNSIITAIEQAHANIAQVETQHQSQQKQVATVTGHIPTRHIKA